MSLFQAVIMGILQGLTEFLPVSSSGHLALFQNLFHVNLETGILYSILLHIGTLIAICIAFYKDIVRLFREGILLVYDVIRNIVIFIKRRMGNNIPYHKIVNSAYRKFVLLIIVSTIPTAIIGVADKELVEISSTILLIPGICLIITGILLFICDRIPKGNKTPKNITYTNAFFIGICQGLATLPGLSRSGTTLTACLGSGFDRKFAVKYSFIMSIPAVLGAAILEMKDFASSGMASSISGSEVALYVVGMMIAAIVGYISIKTMLVIVRKKKFRGFAIYCIILGAVSIGCYIVR